MDWSSSPDIDSWGARPVAVQQDPAMAEQAAPAPVVEPEPIEEPPPQALPPADPFAAAASEKAQSEAAPAKAKGPGRSALGILAFLVLAGYLAYIALLCYEELGGLHARSESAADSEIAALQRDHAAVTRLLLLNGAAAAPFLLGALVHMGGARRTAQFLGIVGLAALIYLLAWNLGEGRAYLRETDAVTKIIMAVVAAWFA